MIVPQDSLPSLMNSFASVVDYHLLIDNLLNPLHVRLQPTCIHMAWIVLVLLGLFIKTLVLYL